MDQLIIPLAMVGFAIFWVLLLHLIAYLGGWKELARRFPDDQTHEGKLYRFQSGAVTPIARIDLPCNYGSSLKLRVCTQGLGISVIAPFRFGHAPLFIPWDEFHRPQIKKSLGFFSFFEAEVASPPIVKMVLPSWVLELQQEGVAEGTASANVRGSTL
ncbi:hypothetical protein NA78x_005212 [Anatilimnocola sp. NA78]|uniref:hypothetical protein n=1 Tax=Anatilimnocola sp. NA78 TaxID=3415683 RepID=UPI003CE57A5E